MKLVIVTVVDEYKKEVIGLFEEAGIGGFSKTDIEGFQAMGAGKVTKSWFAYEQLSADSEMFFSFTGDPQIDRLFKLIETFNQNLDSHSQVHAAVMPIERYV